MIEDDGQHWRVHNEQTLKFFIDHVTKLYEEHGLVLFKWETNDGLTSSQKRAMWLYLQNIAEAMDEAGYDMRQALREDIRIKPNKQLVKEYMWNPVQQAITAQASSKKITTAELDEIQDTLGRHIAQKFGIVVRFPKRGI